MVSVPPTGHRQTYEPIATATLTTAQSSLRINSIPQNYTDLKLIIEGYASSSVGTHLRINGDSSTNYSLTVLVGNGSSVSTNRQTNYNRNDIYWFNYWPSSGAPSNVSLDFMSYSNTNMFKTWLTSYSFPGGEVARFCSLWRSTSSINSLEILTLSSTLAAGTKISLYGIKAAV